MSVDEKEAYTQTNAEANFTTQEVITA